MATKTPANMPSGVPIASPVYLVDETGTPIDSGNQLQTSASVTPAANQRVSSTANDFATGAIVDLLTLLNLAGTSADANTVASLMGRLTKIRDLLNATLTVSVSNANANGQTTMSASAPIAVASDQTPVPMDIARVLGSALSISNPNITETNYQNAARNGKMYTAQARNTTAGTIIVGLAVFNPAAGGKTIAITSIQVSLSASTNALGNSLYLQTVDPALGTPVTPVNLKPGGAGSTASCSSTNTVVVPAGTLAKGFGTVATTTNEVLSPNQVILLPAGSANGVTMYVTPATVVWSVAISWIEF